MIRFSRARALLGLSAIALVALTIEAKAAAPPAQATATEKINFEVRAHVSVPIGMPDVAQASTANYAVEEGTMLATAAGDKVKAEKNATKSGSGDRIDPVATLSHATFTAQPAAQLGRRTMAISSMTTNAGNDAKRVSPVAGTTVTMKTAATSANTGRRTPANIAKTPQPATVQSG